VILDVSAACCHTFYVIDRSRRALDRWDGAPTGSERVSPRRGCGFAAVRGALFTDAEKR
jgi:hypothetical protein